MGKTIEAGFSGRGLGFYGMSDAHVVDGTLSVHEALEASGLTWTVDKVPSGIEGDNGEFIASGPRFWSTRRNDTGAILGQVGAKYEPFQNEQAFEFADGLLGYGVNFHAAGAYNGGANTFLIAKMPDGIKVEGEESLDLYLDMINSHNGTGSISWYVTPIRRVCTNQTRLMIASAVSSAKVRHTATANERMAQVAETLKLVDIYKEALEEGITQLQSIEMELEEVDNFIKEWSSSERVQKNVLETYNTSELLPERGTAWTVINAITEAQLHNPTRRTAGESRFASALNGPNQASVERASRMLLRVR